MSLPSRIVVPELKEYVINLRDQISLKHRQDSPKEADITILPFHGIPRTIGDIPSFFFVFCMKFLYVTDLASPLPKPPPESYKVIPTIDGTSNSYKPTSTGRRKFLHNWFVNLITKKLAMSLKCSISLGLAVFFGVIFSKDDGYWSGLTVAIAFTTCNKTIFKFASDRAHGTALGSVYGVLGSFISQKLMEVRLFALLPWIIFASFLRRSSMYGDAGGFAATISALIICGRRDYGNPIIFTIERLTETFIGLGCSILVQILFRPTRASTMARRKLYDTLKIVHECRSNGELRSRVNELGDCIEDARQEPNFWFLPFPTETYSKLHKTLSEMVDLVLFLDNAMELLGHETKETIGGDLDRFRELFGGWMEIFEEVICVGSVSEVQKHELKKIGYDVELGGKESSDDEDEICNISASILQQIEKEKEKEKVVCMASTAYCVGELMRKVRKVEKGILALLQWENPHTQINLREISSQIKKTAAYAYSN